MKTKTKIVERITRTLVTATACFVLGSGLLFPQTTALTSPADMDAEARRAADHRVAQAVSIPHVPNALHARTTASLGCAPFFIQWNSRASSTTTVEGSVLGL